MKTFAWFIIFAALVLFSVREGPGLIARFKGAPTTPEPATPAPGSPPTAKLTGRVLQRLPGGGVLVEVHNVSLISAEDGRAIRGNTSKYRGMSALFGIPEEALVPQGDVLTAFAHEAGSYTFTSANGDERAIKRFAYALPGEPKALPPPTPTPKWTPKGTLLDRPARRGTAPSTPRPGERSL